MDDASLAHDQFVRDSEALEALLSKPFFSGESQRLPLTTFSKQHTVKDFGGPRRRPVETTLTVPDGYRILAGCATAVGETLIFASYPSSPTTWNVVHLPKSSAAVAEICVVAAFDPDCTVIDTCVRFAYDAESAPCLTNSPPSANKRSRTVTMAEAPAFGQPLRLSCSVPGYQVTGGGGRSHEPLLGLGAMYAKQESEEVIAWTAFGEAESDLEAVAIGCRRQDGGKIVVNISGGVWSVNLGPEFDEEAFLPDDELLKLANDREASPARAASPSSPCFASPGAFSDNSSDPDGGPARDHLTVPRSAYQISLYFGGISEQSVSAQRQYEIDQHLGGAAAARWKAQRTVVNADKLARMKSEYCRSTLPKRK